VPTDHGDDLVVRFDCLQRFARISAQASSISPRPLAIDNAQYDVFGFRDRKVVRAVLGYRSRDEALEAAKRKE
jgi:hypothetical protein